MKLIEKDSQTYLKRLVKELNGLVDGFYASIIVGKSCERCNRARLRCGVLEVRSPNSDMKWFKPGSHEFTDLYGRTVYASRVTK